MVQVVLRDVGAGAEVQSGTLFQGLKFWLSHKVPQRSRFISDVRANGGEILPIEKHADIKIVDHAKKEALPGTHSYSFIEKSIRNGVLEDLQDHRAGPPEGTVRSVGSIIQPAKGTRNKYTQDDDRILWNWVHENPQNGGGTDGNEIYKQLEAKHPQHPWQSWRDRWIKQLKGKPCPFPTVPNAPPTPPSDIPPVNDAPVATKIPKMFRTTSGTNESKFASFDEEDAEALLRNGKDILEIPPENVAEAWQLWARDCDEQRVHTAEEWQTFWEEHVRPKYSERLAKQNETTTITTRKPGTSPISTPSRKHKIASNPPSSPLTRETSNDKIVWKSPSYHPESPSIQLMDSSHFQRRPTPVVDTESASVERGPQEDDQSDADPVIVPTIIEKIKRKRVELEEEFPSSSPLAPLPSPKRIRQTRSDSVREIASTPDRTPVRSGNRPDSPLFVESGDDEEQEEEESNPEHDMAVNESPQGKQPSETLSEPAHGAIDTQGIFQDITQHPDLSVPLPEDDSDDRSSSLGEPVQAISFDVPPPREKWDDEDPFMREPTQAIDFDVPPPREKWDDEDPFMREPTQAIDFEVPPPDEGWDDEDTGGEASSESESIATELYDPRPPRQGTQALLRGPTVAPDFDIPVPEGGWDLVIPSSPPPVPGSPVAESEVSDVDAQTEAWINSHTTKDLTVDDVLSALKCTSMDTTLAEMVLRLMQKDKRVPENQRGVWTTADDEDLESTDARKIQRLESKHGEDCLKARWDFLGFYRGL